MLLRISMIGSPQVLMVDVAVSGPGELAAALEQARFLYGRLVEVDGVEVNRLVPLPINRIQLPLIVDPLVAEGWRFPWSHHLEAIYAM